MKSNEVLKKLDEIVPNPVCELIYNKDYELLIATVLAAQSTDKRVNEVTRVLFSKYDIFRLAKESIKNIENIVNDYDGNVPNDRKYLESLPGVGRKTCNVVLSNIYNVPAIAVDTHVARVSKRLELTKSDDVLEIERDLMKFFPENKWSRVHHQLVLFGRYTCKSKNPLCDKCPFKCKYMRKY